ncbi:hypothetical protein GCM10009562_23170 [Nocardioides aquaticus]
MQSARFSKLRIIAVDRLRGPDHIAIRTASAFPGRLTRPSCLPRTPADGATRACPSVQPVDEVVVVHTDGACVPNPGPGGWGALLQTGRHELELCGGEAGTTTNNRMELMAPIAALETLTRRVTVHLHTDSTYVRNGITTWLAGWERNGWLTSAKEPVKNRDLWQRLRAAELQHDVTWFWVKGHAGNAGNERADRLAARGLTEAVASDRAARATDVSSA